MEDSELKKLVEEKVLCFLDKAEKIYLQDFPFPTISYDLRGRTGGKCKYPPFHKREEELGKIRVNLPYLKRNVEKYLSTTIPHELAHLLVHFMYGMTAIRGQPHGKPWKKVMESLGVPPNRCHNYDNSHLKSRRFFLYKCACKNKDHLLGKGRHTNIETKRKFYICRKCKKKVEWSGLITFKK